MERCLAARMLAIAAAGLLLVRPACGGPLHAPPNAPPRLAQDVVLQAGGLLTGQVIATEGQNNANVQVSLLQQGKTIAQTASAADGRFEFSSVKPGVYQIGAENERSVYRLWAPRTAPPTANEQVVLSAATTKDVVRGQAPARDVVRGQAGGGGPTVGALAILLLLGLGTWAILELIEDDDSPS